MTPTPPTAPSAEDVAGLVARLRERIGAEFDRELTLEETEATRLLDLIESQSSRLTELEAENARLRSDREYVIGWNDGFEHINGPLRFPTMLRKMWSGGEVQTWLDAQRIEAAQTAAVDDGSALHQAEARAEAAEKQLAEAKARIGELEIENARFIDLARKAVQ